VSKIGALPRRSIHLRYTAIWNLPADINDLAAHAMDVSI
jgi:hypothetical protein